jgi:hypothetical protein
VTPNRSRLSCGALKKKVLFNNPARAATFKHLLDSPLRQELIKYIAIAVIDRTAVARMSRVPRIARVSGMANVAVVAAILIENHVTIELADVRSSEFVYVRSVELTNRVSIQLVHIAASPKTDRIARSIVDVIRHRITLEY